MGERERILDHLQNDYTEPVRDPVWKHIPVSRELLRIAEHASFQKLDRIRQLGPAYLVYPGATHTRRSHSLGVLHVARRMITSLVRRNTEVDITLEGVKAFLCACLLHDVGHYPFAHSLKDLDVEAHERLAARQVRTDFAAAIREALRIDPNAVASIIDPSAPAEGVPGIDFYRKILSGVLDPDKLDYLNRDAYFCGVPYGIQDVDFILDQIHPHKASGIAISAKGTTALEDVLFSKYLMYKTVYWHKTVRIATAMIKKAVAAALVSGVIAKEDLYGLDDEEFFATFSAERFPPFRLIRDVRRRELHKQVWRTPFVDGNPAHQRMEDFRLRLAAEEAIAREASRVTGKTVPAESIVVDVPERISFEVSMPITGGAGGSAQGRELVAARTVFGEMGSDDLPGSIRCISVAARRDEELLSALARIDFEELL